MKIEKKKKEKKGKKDLRHQIIGPLTAQAA